MSFVFSWSLLHILFNINNMADFFFFTNPDDLAETITNYGNQGINKYQVSMQCRSRNSLINPTAYAVTSGRIAVLFGDTNNNTFPNKFLTIILQPDQQPGGNTQNVKYYIYKGIIASSLLDQETVSSQDERHKLAIDNSSSYPILQRTQESYNQYISSQGLDPLDVAPINEDWLGFSRTNGAKTGSLPPPSDRIIDDIFNNNWGDEFPPLPYVKEGEAIGDFINNQFDLGSGVLESAYQHTFSFTIVLERAGEHLLFKEASGVANPNPDVNNGFFPNARIVTISSPSDSKPTVTRKKRCEIFNFMDPAAFYGAFANPGMPKLSIRKGSNTVTFPNPDSPNSKANDIYENLLNLNGKNSDGSDNPNAYIFRNRNRMYIDIRDRFGNTYDWMRDKIIEYDKYNLNIGFRFPGLPNPISRQIDYHGEKANPSDPAVFSANPRWPLLAIDLANPGDAVLTGFPINQNNPGVSNTVELAFPDTYNIGCTSIHVSNYDNIMSSGFTAEAAANQGFFHIQHIGSAWAAPIQINSPNYNADPTNATPIANYIQIHHIHCYSDFYENVDVNVHPIGADHAYGNNGNNDYPLPMERQPMEYCDFLWPVDLKLNWPGWAEDRIRSTIYTETTHIENTVAGGYDFMGNIGIARDADATSSFPNFKPKVTLFAFNTIPARENINMLDRAFNEPSGIYAFSDNSSYLQNLGTNITEYKYISRTMTINGQERQIDHLYKRTPEDIQEEIRRNGGIVPTVNIDDFVYFTIEKSEYDEILQQWEDEMDDIPDIIKPIKAWWSFKPVESGWNSTAEKEYIRFEIGIRYINERGTSSGVSMTSKYETFEPKRPGTQNPYDTIKIMDGFDVSRLNINADGNGFSIINYQGVDRIQCTINFVKGPSLSYKEFLSYKDYAIKNIRQIWSNQEGVPSGTTVSDDLLNKGLTARVRSERGSGPLRQYAIWAGDIYEQQGCGCSFRNLDQGEIVFIIDRSKFANIPSRIREDRSAVYGNAVNDEFDEQGNPTNQFYRARHGRLVFNKPGGVVDELHPYMGGNTPAHEFGHILGLTDRYTYVANINSALDVQSGTGQAVNLYLPKSFDINYGEDYRWINNLMAVGANKVPALPLPAKYSAINSEYLNAINGFESPNNNEETTGASGNIFVTPKQWQIIKAFSTDPHAFEGNPYLYPEFKFQPFAFFAPDGTNWPFGSFAGFDAATSINRAVSDYGFNDVSGTHIIEDRIGTSTGPSEILGYFSPFVPALKEEELRTNLSLITPEAANSKPSMFHLRMGNNVVTSLFPSILKGVTNHPDPAGGDNPPYGGAIIDFNAQSPLHDFFNTAGTSDPANIGRGVWNRFRIFPLKPITIDYQDENGDIRKNTFRTINDYENRVFIIKLIVNGTF